MARSLWSGRSPSGSSACPCGCSARPSRRSSASTSSTSATWRRSATTRCDKDTGEHVDTDDVDPRLRGREGPLRPARGRGPRPARHRADARRSTSATSSTSTRSTRSTSARPTTSLPQEGAEKPYRLLVRALDETGKVAIAKIVIRNKQHLAALRPSERRARARDDVLRRRGAAARAGATASREAAQARGRDGEVAGREPEREVRPGQVRRHLPQGAARRCCAQEGRGQAAAGAARTTRAARWST